MRAIQLLGGLARPAVLTIQLSIVYYESMEKNRKLKPFSDQLRDAIRKADISRYRVAKQTGLTQASLSRFMTGVSGLSLESIDKICDCLGLELSNGKDG